jgi:hypothetical protein
VDIVQVAEINRATVTALWRVQMPSFDVYSHTFVSVTPGLTLECCEFGAGGKCGYVGSSSSRDHSHCLSTDGVSGDVQPYRP